MPLQTLKDMIVALLVEKNITIARDTQDNSQHGTTLYWRCNHKKSTKDKGEMECSYQYKKMRHTTWNRRFQANVVLNGKLRDKTHVANVVVVEDPPYVDNGNDLVEEMSLMYFKKFALWRHEGI